MNREQLIKELEYNYPEMSADPEDFIGLQVEGREEIEKIMVTLDVTLDVINQAISNNVDMIISHHPMIFGEKEDIFASNKMTKAKHDLLEQQGINLLVIHTNADFNPNSIAMNLGMSIELNDIEQVNDNVAVMAPNSEFSIGEIAKNLRSQLALSYDFRTNAHSDETITKVVISSGASGYLIDRDINDPKTLFITGEMKHHEWVYANENDLKVLEIGHYSEKIFKDMVEVFIEESDEIKGVEVIQSNEQEPYFNINR